jgi:hypothetical protein
MLPRASVLEVAEILVLEHITVSCNSLAGRAMPLAISILIASWNVTIKRTWHVLTLAPFSVCPITSALLFAIAAAITKIRALSCIALAIELRQYERESSSRGHENSKYDKQQQCIFHPITLTPFFHMPFQTI